MERKIKHLRKDKHLTQLELAKKLNLTQSTIAAYENGIKIPTVENLLAIAKFFQVSTDYLLGLTENLNYEPIESNDDFVSESIAPYTTTNSKEYSKVISYYHRLDNENKEYIIGKMIELYKEQQKPIKYVHKIETDEDILKELESYRLELESKKKINLQDRNIK
ncbi:helix-turn-helix domain-containing protein [Anaerocolumna cellulosilytica]|uniref:helix-turn-helix domain-containing protein n=1 Tax=Anaerocolumna cellulosilytica TaxID=433286 RepID=UPI001619A009|nr:helix-turn-helix transcriptional regulator [Anaerocolumna cellulosilytica]MBB5196090.1 transcriptional regulator with XRE-family HTH domain [Anaerocolumna cellulosilytica]